jgi:hypothetical protein
MSYITDNEAIDLIINVIYNDGDFQYIPIEYIQEKTRGIILDWDLERLILKTRDLGFIRTRSDFEAWVLASKGIEIIKKYGSYLAFVNYEEGEKVKKVYRENFDRAVKNGNLIASVIVALFAVFATILSIDNNKERMKLIESEKDIANKIDSLKILLLKTQQPKLK